ncbi:MAG TPA: MMPL family transporter [Sporosarcina sp.]|nr:MMPL family transporter [Sporosarcina sp.]
MNKKRIWWISIISWLIVTTVLSIVAPGAKEYAEGNQNAGLPDDALSIVADQQIEKHFPEDGGMPLFPVIHKADGLTEDEIRTFTEALASIETDTEYGKIEMPPIKDIDLNHLQAFFGEDEQTFFVPLTLPANLEGSELHTLIQEMKDEVAPKIADDIELSWTGPAAIASDAVELFSRADIVLLISTIGIILVLLLVIYRSPLLTLIPLVAAAIVYAVVDRVIGLTASLGWFTVESQALSIMTILLFAVVTDYSLLIFSRYREELKRHESVNDAMRETMKHVKEPIFFSGSTIVLGVATLFFMVYAPYRNFAPAFVIAAAVMLIGGLTLLPALFAVIGRKAFWPVIPKYGEETKEKTTVWGRVAKVVTKHPMFFMIPITLLLALGAWNVTNMKESYDLIDSFPEDLSSRVGYERLGESFSSGSLAPGTLLITSKEALQPEALEKAIENLNDQEGVEQVSPVGDPLSANQKSAKLQIIFEGNPYGEKAFDTVLDLREDGQQFIEDAGIKDAQLYIAGETAKNTDLRDIDKRDTQLVMILMTVLITLMLGFQTRSVIAPIYMMGTILLSYAATLGASLVLFKLTLGLEAISYRIPLYTFVFLIALGVDYSIMLMARIREELKTHSFEEAVQRGLEKTGGVISSAGLILAATFLVLATMPLYELKLFGMIMALGILIDTFIVRPLLIPAILMKLGKWSFWPKKIK